MSRWPETVVAVLLLAGLGAIIGMAIREDRQIRHEREASRVERCTNVLAVAHTPTDSLRLIRAMPECAR